MPRHLPGPPLWSGHASSCVAPFRDPGIDPATRQAYPDVAGSVMDEQLWIGETPSGKPYGFVPQDNCGTTFFAIQFQGVNNQGFGDCADGFVPGGVFKGCTARDDFAHGLGDPAEGLIAAALQYRANSTCPPLAPMTVAPLEAGGGG